MLIFPGMHYSMGGLYVTFDPGPNNEPIVGSPKNQATNIPGLYASGEVDYAYHGANRLGANSLLSCIYAGQIGGPAMISYAQNAPKSAAAAPSKFFDDAKKQWTERFETIRKMSGPENPYEMNRQLGDIMTANATVVRHNDRLKQTLEKIQEFKERWSRCNVLDTSNNANRALAYVNQLWNMLELAQVITYGALLRDECRGAHYKPEFQLPEPKTKDPREDPEWMAAWRAQTDKWRKTTVARYNKGSPEISYEPIPTPVLPPEPRYYG
jgi:succinate dehydrogenase / fumarate reductase flavoprotein subunit